METATLIIDRSDTRCSNCRKSVSPYAETHETNLGYGPINGTPGCGAKFIATASGYVGPGISERIKEMRPDLPFEGMAW